MRINTFSDSRDIIHGVIKGSPDACPTIPFVLLPVFRLFAGFLVLLHFSPFSALLPHPRPFRSHSTRSLGKPGWILCFASVKWAIIEHDRDTFSSIQITAPSGIIKFILEPVPLCSLRVRVKECLSWPMHNALWRMTWIEDFKDNRIHGGLIRFLFFI